MADLDDDKQSTFTRYMEASRAEHEKFSKWTTWAIVAGAVAIIAAPFLAR